MIGYVEYRPYAEFRLEEQSDKSLTVYYAPTVRDSETSELVTLNGPRWTVEPKASEARIVNLLYHIVAEHEMHECREMFRVKGKKVFDPHTAIWPSRH